MTKVYRTARYTTGSRPPTSNLRGPDAGAVSTFGVVLMSPPPLSTHWVARATAVRRCCTLHDPMRGPGGDARGPGLARARAVSDVSHLFSASTSGTGNGAECRLRCMAVLPPAPIR